MANKLNTILFSTFLVGISLFYFILPREKISIEEKRKLAVIPILTFDSYLNGVWSDSMDNFVDDQFPFRNRFIAMADVFHSLKGIKLDHQEKIFVEKKEDENVKPDFLDLDKDGNKKESMKKAAKEAKKKK